MRSSERVPRSRFPVALDEGDHVAARSEQPYAARDLRVEEHYTSTAGFNRSHIWQDNPDCVRVHLHAMDFAGVLAICDSALPLVRDSELRHAPDHPTPIPSTFRIRLILTGWAQMALGDYESALEHLLAARADMDRLAALFDWYWRIHLESALTDLWLAKGDLARARPQA